jgi:hypothetical protein
MAITFFICCLILVVGTLAFVSLDVHGHKKHPIDHNTDVYKRAVAEIQNSKRG